MRHQRQKAASLVGIRWSGTERALRDAIPFPRAGNAIDACTCEVMPRAQAQGASYEATDDFWFLVDGHCRQRTARPRSVRPGPATQPARQRLAGARSARTPAAGETAGQTRREGRQDARDSRAEAKNTGETRPQARETARETREETRQNIQGTLPANLGVTFNNAATNGLVVSNLATNSVLGTAGLRSGDQSSRSMASRSGLKLSFINT